jgi:predicted dehydrogenase
LSLEVGLVGLGFGERVTLTALRRIPGVRVAAIASAHPEKARDAARRLNIPRAAKGWRELVRDPKIQAVVFAVPPAVQFAAASEAVRHSKHVFCEKPLAPDHRQAQRLADLAVRRRVAAAVNFEFPRIGAWEEAARLLKSAAIGRLREVQVTWSVQTYLVQRDLSSWKTESAQGGAALNNFATHVFHYLEHFAGPLRRLNCRLVRASDLRRIKGETGVHLWAEMAAGVPVTAMISTHAAGDPVHEITFLGSRGRLSLVNRSKDYGTFELLLDGKPVKLSVRAGSARRAHAAPGAEDGRTAPVERLLREWVAAIVRKKPSKPGLAEGARVQRLVECARASSRTKKWVNCA